MNANIIRNRRGSSKPGFAACLLALSLLLGPDGAAGQPSGAYQGLWWNAGESGWGINFAHQGDIIFATWFTYDAQGRPWWLIAELHQSAEGVYSGPVSTVTGPPFNAVPFRPAAVETTVGTMTATFGDASHATIAYTVNGVAQAKAIVPQAWGPRPTCAWGAQADPGLAANYQDLWWSAPAGSEPGWGINLTHQGDTIFGTWFTYDAQGKPWWLIADLDKVAPNTYAGPVSTVTGPPFGSVPFDPAAVVETLQGAATIAFADGNRGTFEYTVNGITQAKPITRQVFVPPGTVCVDDGMPATVTVPGAPTGLVATPRAAGASIAFAAPASDGGSAVTGYTARCAGAGVTRAGTGAASPILVSGLADATPYACTVTATNARGTGAASAGVSVTPTAGGAFVLGSAAGGEGGTLPADYSCDGTGSSPALSWSKAPAGTREFALLMTTLPGDGTTRYHWVLHGIPATATALARDSYGVGIAGVGSEGTLAAYQPPCWPGSGARVYTYTLYALSASPSLPAAGEPVTGAALAEAIAPITLGSAALSLTYTRTTASAGSTPNCVNIRNSTLASTTGSASVSCDGTYAYVGSSGIATHAMMNGITATNLQVPTAQNFLGANAWKIPLHPAIAATPTSAVDGPIGVAINGVPIFNPCKQGGCQNGDTKVLGELDVCNGHAGRADDYHYHAAPNCLMAGKPAGYWDTHPLGWALDGFAIFGYNDADGRTATRDGVCGGNTRAVVNGPAGYSYHVTDASPYVLSCLRGTPSPDLANQGAKYRPMRQPPVTPFPVAGMTLTTDAADGYQVLQFTSARSFTTTETGSDSYVNAPGVYRIRYKPVIGAALAVLLAQPQNAGKSACWNFQFTTGSGATTQPTVSYCR